MTMRTTLFELEPGNQSDGCHVAIQRLVSLPVKCLTVSQPFSSMIAAGEKWVENRVWSTNYRGPLAIHAGKGTQYLTRKALHEYPHGCIIAVANLFACMLLESMRRLNPDQKIRRSELTIADVLCHRHTEGPYCWILRDVRPCEPVPCTGERGLWMWSGQEAG